MAILTHWQNYVSLLATLNGKSCEQRIKVAKQECIKILIELLRQSQNDKETCHDLVRYSRKAHYFWSVPDGIKTDHDESLSKFNLPPNPAYDEAFTELLETAGCLRGGTPEQIDLESLILACEEFNTV